MTGGENRRISIVKALRKRTIANVMYNWYDSGFSYYNNLHQYSKNKVHCSCPLCSAKTRNKAYGRRNAMAPKINYTISDMRKIQRLEYVDD